MKSILRKLGIALACGAVFSVGAVLGQSITSSLQLSQDSRGNFGVDSVGNLVVFNNRHINAQTTSTPPTLGTCTGGAITAGSTDFSGQVAGATAGSCAVVFGQAYGTAPRCLANANNTTAANVYVSTVSTTGMTISSTAATSTLTWICVAVS
jgi:hypothetical protein